MNHDLKNKSPSKLPWVLFAFIIVIPFISWAAIRNWSLSNLSALSVFPILGVWAWSIMWTHYVLGTHRIMTNSSKNHLYARISGYLVLLLIILHPTLLAWSQWEFTNKLPPTSFYNYAGKSLKLFVFMGAVSLVLFLSYEVLERFKEKSIVKKNWKWISLSQVIAMTLIFMHALKLGNITSNVYFQLYWIILGAILIPCFGVILENDWTKKA
ncbi:hypothetical protein KDA00_03690 [Candidatus Saccharibacteria bacterium]|nr:hypothetical protein [Candidatus Saccharibacteria bacterium]